MQINMGNCYYFYYPCAYMFRVMDTKEKTTHNIVGRLPLINTLQNYSTQWQG